MEMLDIITKKRDGRELSGDEIRFFINGYVGGKIPDYQVAALLMAIYFQGMNDRETADLTQAMRYSGDTVDLSAIDGIKVDKHSTGGVGDKTTIIIAPIAAAAGVKIAKMSGKGLGFTGGTIDKLESIPGLSTKLGPDEFFKQVNEIGLAVISQSAEITPADKLLYALRDVTATVGNMSLIASSIMSKKLAAGSDAIVLDVKYGSGAFLKDVDEATDLANKMISIGKAAGRNTIAVLSDMTQPLGNAVGNILEVKEAIDVLSGRGPKDIHDLSVLLSSLMIYLGEKAATHEEAVAMAEEIIASGKGLAKLKEMIERQGGDPAVVDDPGLFETAAHSETVTAYKSGYIKEINAGNIGIASQHSGAGRMSKDDVIDNTAGIILEHKVGDRVEEGDVLATVYANDASKLRTAVGLASDAYVITDEQEVAGRADDIIIGL
jgi:pyrimidine-nucleoside phosphorylase